MYAPLKYREITDMAKFQKGNKAGKGRPKGAKNKATLAGKEVIAEYFQNGGLEALLADIEALDAKDKVTAKIKLIEYYMPKQRETNNNHNFKNDVLSVNFSKTQAKPITSENDMFDDD